MKARMIHGALLVLLVVLLVPAILPAEPVSAQTVIFSDDFEYYDSLENHGWTIETSNPQGDPQTATDPENPSNRVAYIQSRAEDGSIFPTFYHSFSELPLEPGMEISIRFYDTGDSCDNCDAWTWVLCDDGSEYIGAGWYNSASSFAFAYKISGTYYGEFHEPYGLRSIGWHTFTWRVEESGGVDLLIDGNLIIDDLAGFTTLSRFEVHSGSDPSTYSFAVDDFLASGSTATRSHAIIVSAREEHSGKKLLFDNAADVAYVVLRSAGYSNEQIHYLNTASDGTKAVRDIDKDGTNDVDDLATCSNFTDTLNEIRTDIGDNRIILYLYGHGAEVNGDYYFIFDAANDDYIDDADFCNALKPISNEMIIIMNSCHSGGFITSAEHSLSEPNRIIITSTPDYLKSRNLDNWSFSNELMFRLFLGDNVKDSFSFAARYSILPIIPKWLDDNGDKSPSNWFELMIPGNDGSLAANTYIGPCLGFSIDPWFYVRKLSPGEVRVYDLDNNLSGVFEGQVFEEIAGSYYDQGTDTVVILPSSSGPYVDHIDVIGTTDSQYGIEACQFDGTTLQKFYAEGITMLPTSVHRFFIDWDALSQDEDGVTVEVDSDGDEIVDYTVTSGNALAAVETATGTGTAWFSPSAGNITGLSAVAEGSLPPAAQATKPVDFPDGLFSFNITGLSHGAKAYVTITLPTGAAPTQYWKYHANEGGWVQVPMTVVGPPNVIRITLQDGGVGDDDLTANGTIVDQGGPGGGAVGWETYPISKARILLPWIGLLSAVIAGAGLLALRRRRIRG
jgi:hypothetical protein